MLDEILRIGLVARSEIPGALELARKVLKLLSREEVLLERKLGRELGRSGVTWQTLRGADAIVTIGGDGTVLLAQGKAPGVPVLGINLGGKGFLASAKPGEIGPVLKKLVNGELPIMERMRLAGETSKPLPEALNDAVVCSTKSGKAITLTVLVDGKTAMEFQGDGIIIATPTGCTAYAFAAGGPIIDPRLEAFSLVPICPFPMAPAYPMVVPASSRIEVRPTRPGLSASIIIDGRPAARIGSGEKAIFYKSDMPARFFCMSDFYRKLREKLQ